MQIGHIQRGGTPTAYDRVLTTRFGLAAVDAVVAEHGRVDGRGDHAVQRTARGGPGEDQVTVVRPTGVPGTGLADGIVDLAAVAPLAGQNAEQLFTRFGGLDAEQQDPESVRYWAMTPEELAAHVVHAIDAPAGVGISDITIRATGEDYVY